MHALKWTLLLGLCASLLACMGGNRTEIREYVLTALPQAPDVASPPPGSAPGAGPVVCVGPISLPGYLRRPQIVTREASNRIHASATSRWGEELGAGFARVLALNLSTLVPTDRIAAFPWPVRGTPDYSVAIEVERFEREPDGKVVLEARWILSDRLNDTVSVRRASLRERVDGDGFTTTVDAMSRSIGSLSRTIADAIRLHAAGQPVGELSEAY